MFFVLGEVFEHFGNLDKGAELLVALNEQAKLHVLRIFRIVLPGHSRKNPQTKYSGEECAQTLLAYFPPLLSELKSHKSPDILCKKKKVLL